MRILVTGGAGFIGSNLVRLLLKERHEVLNIDKLTYAGRLQSLVDVEKSQEYKFLHADILDEENIKKAFYEFRPQWIIHLAAESHVDRSIDSPRIFLETNILGTFNMLQIARSYYEALCVGGKKDFRFLHVSTDEVYGSLGEAGVFTEETPYDPHSPYSASKASADHLVRSWYSTYGLPTIVTNCSNNYGPFQFPEKLIPLTILKALKGELIPIYGKGQQTRDWLYVEDHCEALLTVISRGKPGRTYNIGGNNEMKNVDLVYLVCRLLNELRPGNEGFGYESLITFVPDRPGHDFRYAMDISRISSELGWRPRQSRESGFRKTVKWYLDNKEWWETIINESYRLERLGKPQP